MLLLAIGPMGTFYVITLYLQQVQNYNPLQTGASWLPFAAGLMLGAGAAPKLLLKVAPRIVAAAEALLSAGAAFWFSFIQTNTNYWLHLAPAMFVLALGFGLGIIALTQAAVYHTREQEAGIASALLNSAQQIGVALGLAVLAGVAATISNSPEQANLTESSQLVFGYGGALVVAAGLLLAAGVLAAATLSSQTTAQSETPATAGVP